MPQGAIVAGRVDGKNWLTMGCREWLPVMAVSQPVLMAAEGVEAPVRFGYWLGDDAKPVVGKPANVEGNEKKKKEPPRVGWSALPEGCDLYLRMSGLLWPEAAHRLANSAYLTREPLGRGQIILFASSPTFRAVTLGQTRLFLNAMIYGPGFGAAQPIRP